MGGVVTLNFSTKAREQLVDVTSQIQNTVRKAGVKEGVITVYVPHTTCGVMINENADPAVAHDIIFGLARLIPRMKEFHHMEGNSDAHIKASIVGCSCQIPVSNEILMLGTWQAVYLAEFDGPRNRKLLVCT